MSKINNHTFPFLWIIVLVVASALFIGYNISKNKATQQSSTAYLTFDDPMYNFRISYPQAWNFHNDTQVFENGDAVAFSIFGPTQKEQTELTDGAQVAVSKPFNIKTDLAVWAKKYYNSTSVFSQNTINGHTYQKIYTCGAGCMTYYYTKINENVYGIATFAQGADKMIYENAILYMLKSLQFERTKTTEITKESAVDNVKMLPEVREYLKRVPKGIVAVNGQEDETFTVQVYELLNSHTATFNWYTVNKKTGEIKKEF